MLLTYDQFCILSNIVPSCFLVFCNVLFMFYPLRISGFLVRAAVSFIIPKLDCPGRSLAVTDRTTQQKPVASSTENKYCACEFMCGTCVQIRYLLVHSHTTPYRLLRFNETWWVSEATGRNESVSPVLRHYAYVAWKDQRRR
jgi:hypothetical protein